MSTAHTDAMNAALADATPWSSPAYINQRYLYHLACDPRSDLHGTRYGNLIIAMANR